MPFEFIAFVPKLDLAFGKFGLFFVVSFVTVHPMFVFFELYASADVWDFSFGSKHRDLFHAKQESK